MRYKIVIQYDGTHYSGWQVQPDALSIQEQLESTLQLFLQEKVRVIGSGRTDRGVHALGQVAHFTVEKPINDERFIKAANGLLPLDIRILETHAVPDTFHAQYSARGKIYHYHLWLEKAHSPFHRLYRAHIRKKIDPTILQEAAQKFLGTHDFTTFANSAHEGAAAKDAVRTIFRIDCHPQEGGLRLEFEGDGFLYKMVRNIVGMLLDVASGERALDDIEKAFLAKTRAFIGKAAPANGLFLVRVIY